eukprot:CAMPEP_0170547334 /NCGR_PEP_ID=MMETSP0211-20121228/5716_1 /TAXON_ID=311385 /ORGANISM="Pseudokeronopsis sp., Strain OXSARD2" /LENGTH=233 /DNA_ID=CAMNT_0010852309 /DNA_START=188 /DNA_END=885 /DNA_ORIENTATION=-
MSSPSGVDTSPSRDEDAPEEAFDEDYVPNGSVDWVSKGAVTHVKDQGRCGSCWAFSTTGALEGVHYQHSGKLYSFSEQQLVDCETHSHGCNGGSFTRAFQYAESHKMTLEDDYRYTGKDGSCHSSKYKGYYSISSYTNVKSGSESALVSSIDKGPTSVAVQANQYAFENYSGGIIDSGCGSRTDHAILAVGYGSSNGHNYYKVKNSWGTHWGEKGYARIGRNGNGAGICGIQT